MILGDHDKRIPRAVESGLIGFNLKELLHHMDQQKRGIEWALDNS